MHLFWIGDKVIFFWYDVLASLYDETPQISCRLKLLKWSFLLSLELQFNPDQNAHNCNFKLSCNVLNKSAAWSISSTPAEQKEKNGRSVEHFVIVHIGFLICSQSHWESLTNFGILALTPMNTNYPQFKLPHQLITWRLMAFCMRKQDVQQVEKLTLQSVQLSD